MEDLGGSMAPGMAWRLQMSVVLHEAAQQASTKDHPSLFCSLRRLSLWERVFSFLAPKGEKDVHNTLCLTAELMSDHLKVREFVLSKIHLAQAWHMFSQIQFDGQNR